MVDTQLTYSTNWPVVGHTAAISHLSRSLQHGRIRHAYLIAGPASIGKTTFARAFAMTVNCLSDHRRPCGLCRACTLIQNDNFADVKIIEADGGKLKVDQIRDLQTQLSMRPVEGRYRVVILRRFQEATTQAMDALLKTLEEPAPGVILLLTADTTDNLLPTIKSRCQSINLRLLSASLVRKTLEEQYHLKQDKAALLGQLSGGRLGWAIRAAADESMLSQRDTWLKQLEDMLGMTRVGRFAMAESLSRDKKGIAAMLELWLSYWRDVMLLSHTTVTPITNRDHDHTLRQIAIHVRIDDVLKVMTAIQRTAKYLDANVNTRLALEVLMLDMPRLRLMPAPPGASD
ncbi:MAG: DNA polymerase III subunit delta' [Anaerolineae bacterium]|nr:DNA polymerase III subunit delta' [Anaerolineae bacterium]